MDFEIYQSVINQNKNKSEENVSARFYDRVIKTKSFNEKGLPIFKTVCYCEIRIKDNTTEIFDQPATSDKIERFPVEYARYQLTKKRVPSGTPLEQFAFLTASEIESCKYRGIFTVESLSELSNEHANNLGLSFEHKAAQNFVAIAHKNQQIMFSQVKEQEYLQKISELKEEIEILKKQVNRRKKK